MYGSSQPVVRSEGRGYPSFDSEYTAILDLMNRREIDAVRILNGFPSLVCVCYWVFREQDRCVNTRCFLLRCLVVILTRRHSNVKLRETVAVALAAAAAAAAATGC